MSGRLQFEEEPDEQAMAMGNENAESSSAAKRKNQRKKKRLSEQQSSANEQRGNGKSSYELFDLTQDDSDDAQGANETFDSEEKRKVKSSGKAAPHTVVLVSDRESERDGERVERVFEIGTSSSTATKDKKKKRERDRAKKNKAGREAKTEKDKRVDALLGSASEDDEDEDVLAQDSEEQIERETLVENVLKMQHKEEDSKKKKKTKSEVREKEKNERARERDGETTAVVAGSHWLQTFLSKKHDQLDCALAEDELLAPSSDEFLRLFHADYADRARVRFISDDEEDEGEEQDKQEEMEEKETKSGVQEEREKDVDEESETEAENVVTVNIFNLPYKIDEKELREWLAKFGFTARSVSLGSEQQKRERGGLPLGAAAVALSLPATTTLQSAIESLTGAFCHGRAVRAQAPSTKDSLKRRISFGSSGTSNAIARYFVTDISCKCNSCGQVGHKQAECVNDPLPVPCHLCAGSDHEAGQCPNIICYRCGRFGHHSRECSSNLNRSRPVVCFHCGGLDHEIVRCPQRVVKPFDSLVCGPFVRCMTCADKGHVMCARMPWDKSWEKKHTRENPLYCPNCGSEGHHVDWPPRRDDPYKAEHFCRVPKCEAFFRFPQLRDVDTLLTENHNSLFRSLSRGPNDMSLFPSLSIPAPPLNPPIPSLTVPNSSRNTHARYDRSGGYEPPRGGRSVALTADYSERERDSFARDDYRGNNHGGYGRSGYDRSGYDRSGYGNAQGGSGSGYGGGYGGQSGAGRKRNFDEYEQHDRGYDYGARGSGSCSGGYRQDSGYRHSQQSSYGGGGGADKRRRDEQNYGGRGGGGGGYQSYGSRRVQQY